MEADKKSEQNVGAAPRGRLHRRSIRLAGYDYKQGGGYFITICVHKQMCLLGEVGEGQMRLNDAGLLVQSVWDELSAHYPGVETDAFTVMPNHVHGIIVLVTASTCSHPHAAGQGQAQGPAPTMSLPDVVHRFKTLTTKKYADGVKTMGWRPFAGRLWQRNYYEHIIRDDETMNGIREYIVNNPLQWELDRENPAREVGAAPCGRPLKNESWRI